MAKKKRGRRTRKHQIIRVWGWPDDDGEIRWSWACTCGKNVHDAKSEPDAREAADAHLREVAA